MKNTITILLLFLAAFSANAQQPKDSVIQPKKPLKLHHAEPLYIDLIRDLGARKGEKEVNVGFGINDEKDYLSYTGFAEYEFAVADRFGLEVEIPFEICQNNSSSSNTTFEIPKNRLEGLKVAAQYTFLVSEEYQASMAVGYIQEFELSSFSEIAHKGRLFEGTLYNPIFIAAKRVTPNIHTLLYAGPIIEQKFEADKWNTSAEVNASMHYVFANGNFAGLETNMEFSDEKPSIVFRPQLKFQFSPKVSLGLVAGIPATDHAHHGLSGMTRLIWVP